MKNELKAMGLLAQVAKGILAHSESETQSQLGDRRSYIGMSDIGKSAECLRAAVANKVNKSKPANIVSLFKNGEFEKIKQILRKQLILQRGHWLEHGISQALTANQSKFFSQLEIETEFKGVPIKAHLDFVLVANNGKPIVRILELKSTEKIPEYLYTAYETQLYGQLGFLVSCWNEPKFNLKNERGELLYSKLTFPELCKAAFNIEMPNSPQSVDIEGWVLSLAMSDAKAFGPYTFNETMLRFCQKQAQKIWQHNQTQTDLNQLDYCKGFHPLCNWCDHSNDCPKFTSVGLNDSAYNDALLELDMMKQAKADLEAKIKETEKQLSQFYLNCNVQNDWLETADYRFKTSTINGRKTLDDKGLFTELTNILGEDQAESLFNKFTKQHQPYQRLFINKRN